MSSSQKPSGSKSVTLLEEWQSSFHQEINAFTSIALFVEAKYLEAKKQEADSSNSPTHYKAVIMSDLALTLTNALGRYSQLMKPLLWELLNCIYTNFAAMETRSNGDKLLKGLKGLPTYFDKYRETMSILEDVSCFLLMACPLSIDNVN